MERTFEEVAFGGLRNRTVAVQIAEPFSVNGVGQELVHPVVCKPVHLKVLCVAGSLVGISYTEKVRHRNQL